MSKLLIPTIAAACCLPGTLSAAEPQPPVGRYTTVFEAPPRRLPNDGAVDSPLLGNGDMGVTFGGEPQRQRYWLCKSDHWMLDGKRGMPGPRPLGVLELAIDGLTGHDYEVELNLEGAHTVSRFMKDGKGVRITSWVAATANVLVIELEALGAPFPVSLKLSPHRGKGIEVEAGEDGTMMWLRAKCDPLIESAAAVAIPGVEGRSFNLEPGTPRTVHAALSSRNESDSYLDEARRALGRIDLASLGKQHADWWRDYWRKAWVSIGDRDIEKGYYLSNYVMGSASRNPDFPPPLFGLWNTKDRPRWNGDYHMNYNGMAPFYGLYSSNRIAQADPFNQPVLDMIERGKWIAREAKAQGVLFPVGIGPKGHSWGGFFGQKSNTAYAVVNMAMQWYTTCDPAYAKRIFPYVIEVLNFWEDYLTWEEDGQRFVIERDSIHEGSGKDFNAILSVALVKNTLQLAIDLASELGVEAERRKQWQHILAHMPGYTFQEVMGKTVFRYSERGTAWWHCNSLGTQHVFPAGQIHPDSDPELLEVARNTIAVQTRWHDDNGSNSFFPAAVRVGYDPQEILRQLRHYAWNFHPNGYRSNSRHGIENCSTIPATVNEMLCMGHANVLRVFPVWPRANDARFTDLRVWGAFLVSSSLRDGEIEFVRIRSERGRTCNVQNPWPGRRVAVYHKGAAALFEGERFELPTVEGGDYLLGPDKTSLTLLQAQLTEEIGKPDIVARSASKFEPSTVTITAGGRAAIHYTVDGSRPTGESPRYTTPFQVEGPATVRAIAIEKGENGGQESIAADAVIRGPESGELLVNTFDQNTDFWNRTHLDYNVDAGPPYWWDRPVGKGRSRWDRHPNPGRQGIIAIPPCFAGYQPITLTRFVRIPEGTPTLRVVVSTYPHEGENAFTLEVGINDGEQTDWIDKRVLIDKGEPSPDGWHSIELDLSAHAGKTAEILLRTTKPPAPHKHSGWVFYDEISILAGP